METQGTGNSFSVLASFMKLTLSSFLRGVYLSKLHTLHVSGLSSTRLWVQNLWSFTIRAHPHTGSGAGSPVSRWGSQAAWIKACGCVGCGDDRTGWIRASQPQS